MKTTNPTACKLTNSAAKELKRHFKNAESADCEEATFLDLLRYDQISFTSLNDALERFCQDNGFIFSLRKEPHFNEETICFALRR